MLDFFRRRWASALLCLLFAAPALALTPEQAGRIEAAVGRVLGQGLRTADIWSAGTRKVGTREMGDAVVAQLRAQAN